MKIGFFGDSFCAWCDSPSAETTYETYIKKLKKHYSAEIVNLGINGSSIYDVILLQVKPFVDKNNYPDVCVFVWTNYARIFHKKYRGMNLTSLKFKDNSDPIINAAKEYFIHLLDWDLHKFQYVSALEYFDLHTLSKFPKTTKILHIWNYEKLYHWKHGTEISIPNYSTLVDLATDDRKIPDGIDWALNHLDGERKNSIVFESIKYSIDNYIKETI